MKLLPSQLVAEASGGHHEHHAEHAAHEHEHPEHGAPEQQGHEDQHAENHVHDHAGAGGIEWEDDIVDVNRLTTPANMHWTLIDRETGAENAAIGWRFRVGDKVKSGCSTRWPATTRCTTRSTSTEPVAS
jgi:hypothetical protein